jgi:hypothetical protein
MGGHYTRPGIMSQSLEQLKRKLRQLRKLEITVRFKDQPLPENPKLIWDIFFSTQTHNQQAVKYSLQYLLALERQEFKAILEEYFYRLYFQNYRERGVQVDIYDPHLLSLLGLPAYAGIQDIKRRFRELAKRYHPDAGGESEQFIALMDIYEQLTNKPSSNT